MNATKPVGQVIKYPGSKWKLADWIIQHMPPHETYLEPYFGSGAVFFKKPPVDNETIGDVDSDVINLFKTIRDHPEELAQLVEMTPWARYEYESIETSALEEETFIHTGDPLEDARRFLVRCWMAHGAKTSDRAGWACNIVPTKYGSIVSRWNRVPDIIRAIPCRLKQAQIECQPAEDLIGRYKKPEVLIYADPPYVRSTRTQRQYRHEMTDEDHIRLLNLLNEHPGPVLLSGYPSRLYEDYIGHWKQFFAKAHAQGTAERTEVLWLNPEAARRLSRVNGKLFGKEAMV